MLFAAIDFMTDRPFQCCCFHLSVGQQSVEVDPEVSNLICSFDYSSIKCDCLHRFACCFVVKSAPQCLCLVWIDQRSSVLAPLGYIFQLLLHSFGCLLGVPCCFVCISPCEYPPEPMLVHSCEAIGAHIVEDWREWGALLVS